MAPHTSGHIRKCTVIYHNIFGCQIFLCITGKMFRCKHVNLDCFIPQNCIVIFVAHFSYNLIPEGTISNSKSINPCSLYQMRIYGILQSTILQHKILGMTYFKQSMPMIISIKHNALNRNIFIVISRLCVI